MQGCPGVVWSETGLKVESALPRTRLSVRRRRELVWHGIFHRFLNESDQRSLPVAVKLVIL